MRRSIRQWAALAAGALGAIGAPSCDTMSSLGNTPYSASPNPLGSGDAGGDGAATDDGGGGDDGGPGNGDDGSAAGDSALPSCVYKDDKSFCSCMSWSCGGFTVPDSNGVNEPVYCGSCSNDQYCMPGVVGVGVGTCGGSNPLQYSYQKQKIDMLVSMGENDNTTVNYGFASNIGDGRGYTIGKVGFCTGTGDFIIVAACYNDLKPGNVLSKYWGHRDSTGTATDGLIYYNDQYIITGANQGATALIDKFGNFTADVATAAAESDGIFRGCQDAMADADYLAAAAVHATERGLQGPLTIGFLYDTELNFGDDDDPDGTLGAISVMKNADTDYGPGLPTDFTGKPWEESRWLGFLIKERVIVMAKNSTWKTDIDQNATWEGARRLNTDMSNSQEGNTSLSMDYDLISQYKSGYAGAGTPCWPTGLASALDSQASIYIVSTDKSASKTDPTQWGATGTLSTGTYAACPPNPTP
jgi:hypothetical protein